MEIPESNGKSAVQTAAPKPKKSAEHQETSKSKDDGDKIGRSEAHTSSSTKTVVPDEYPHREKDPKKNTLKPESSDNDDQKPKKRRNNGDNSYSSISNSDKNSKNTIDGNINNKNGKKSRKSSTSTIPLTKSESGKGKQQQQKQSDKS